MFPLFQTLQSVFTPRPGKTGTRIRVSEALSDDALLRFVARLAVGLVIACASGHATPAFAQEGIGQQGNQIVGLIGSDKGGLSPTACAPGHYVTGVQHWDKGGGTSSTIGMTARLDLSCTTIATDGSAVTFGATTTVSGLSYSGQVTPRTAACPAGQIAFLFYGRDRSVGGQFPWASQVGLACRPVILDGGDWLQLDSSVAVTRLDAGVIEGNGTHISRGGFCGGHNYVSGYAIQAGGEGYDGIRAACANFAQARLSAELAFDDFAWDTTIGGAGWLVDLTWNGTAMAGGVGKTPYVAPSANDANEFQDMFELYVANNTNYGAKTGQMPTGIPANSFIQTGSCTTGLTLGLKVDDSCQLTVTGKPEIAVTASGATAIYTGYDEPQTLTVTATNYGPGATDNDDGYTLVTTLPAGWSVNGALPADCTQSGQLVTCALNSSPLSSAAAPGAAGGMQSFDLPISVDYPTVGGTHNYTVMLGRAAPDGDADPTNDDYDPSNDQASGSFDFQPTPAAIAEPVKTVSDGNGNGIAEPGEQLTYTITLTNTGSTDATGYGVTDHLDPHTTHQSSSMGGSHSGGSPGGTVNWSGLTVPAQVGATPGSLVLTTIVTVVDPLPPGAKISNGAYETGTTPPDCSANPLPASCAVMPAAASMSLEKTATLDDANGNTFADVGEAVNYTFTVTNTGGSDLTGVTIDDPKVSVSGGPVTLAVGAVDSTSFTAAYILTQADLDAGRVENQAKVTGTAANGAMVSDLSDDPNDATNADTEGDGEPDDPTVILLPANAAISVEKVGVLVDANGNSLPDAGETVNYIFSVTNTGNVTLSSITLTDPDAAVSGGPIASLQSGQTDSTTFSASHILTQQDIDAGTFVNQATVSGTVASTGFTITDLSDDP
ncbi:DUF7507 domain-containing protein, partial [Nitratireductor soli]|uniref:DUF7507 domain-containing protein n=1 Tax=Nitratireductor soli TaxID=1670619 RepID=UPI00065E4EE0